MTRNLAFVALLALVVAVPLARAQEADGDAPPAEEAPKPSRHPVRAAEPAPEPAAPAPEAAPAPDDQPPVETESGEVVKLKHHKKKRHHDEDADQAAAPIPVKSGGSDEGQQFGSRRIQVFLVPVGESASLAAGPTQLALEGEVGKLPGYHPVDLVKELAAPPSDAEQARLGEAQRILSDANKQLAAHAYEEAASRYQKAVRTLEQAGSALDAPTYADAWTRLAVALQLAGDDAPSKEAFQMAARADLAGAVNGRDIDRKLGANLETARDDVANGPTGVLSIVTQPPGARVFLGGVYKGTTPVTVDKAPVGQNLLRVDRPGAVAVVQLVEVKEAFDTPVKIKMKFTDEALELQKTLVQVPRALSHENGIPDMLKGLGRRFRLERAVFATVEMVKTNVADVRAVLVDFPRDARLADDHHEFQLDMEGGVQDAIARWFRTVLDGADKSRNRASKDPLDRSDGTEAWYSGDAAAAKKEKADPDAPEWERSNYQPKSTHKQGVKSADPLDHEDGTDDW